MTPLRALFAWAAFCALSFTSASAPAYGLTGDKDPADPVKVYHLHISFTEAFLVKGASDKLVLIEAGVPGHGEDIEKQIRDFGFKPEDIGLLILTHGHGDHAGSARYLQEKYHMPVAGSVHDLEKFTRGKSELSKSEDVGPWAAVFRPVSDLDYPPLTPDIVVTDKEIDITKYGIPGRIIPMPGHTPGSILVTVGHNLFVGDLFRGTFKPQGQNLVPDGFHVTEHVFHEDRKLAREQLQELEKIMGNTVDMVYPTHWGPMTAREVHTYIRNLPLLEQLVKLQTRVLDEIVHKKSDLLKQVMTDDASLVSVLGTQLDKASFIKGFVENPQVKLESITPSDFRIVHANDSMAVMSYKEAVKFSDKQQPFQAVITITYVKDKDAWKAVAVQGTPIPG